VLVDSVTGERNRAAELANEAITTFDELTKHDPANLEWLRSSTKPRIARANLHLADGELMSARRLLEPALDTLEDMTASDRTDVSVHEALADAYFALAWLEYEAGNAAAALGAVDGSLEHLTALGQDGPLDRDLRGRTASALVLSGEIQALDGETEAARRAWLRALALLEDPQDQSRSPRVVDPLARALALSGSTERAQQIRALAESMGYRPLRPWPKTAGGRVAAGGG
jgi:tetratricopeptide (TPR) repeat protein